jgi:CRISPR-associated protein Cmr2
MNYIGYTIGPIYDTIFDTLNDDKKTKNLKSGSYFFSHFMKILLKNIKDDFNIIVPYIDGNILEKEYSNMGLFHDRLIATSSKNIDDIEDIFCLKLEKSYKEMAQNIKDESIAYELADNITDHFIAANEDELLAIDENIIFAINKILDSKELKRPFKFNVEKNWIKEYQKNEISNSKVKTLEAISKNLGFNYYAVITADGDKIGAKIKDIATNNPSDIKILSQKLYNFFTSQKDIYEITNKDFYGELIYAGGDDILAFLPVKHNDKTFLDYINELDKRFKDIVGNDVSLSFGVNIAYYKYPLRNAIQSAFELLNEAKSNKNVKNRIALKITKHSGQCFGSTIAMQDERYKLYKVLIDGVLKQSITMPHSLHHSLKRYEEAILATYKYPNSSIQPMFNTVFNDAKDKDKDGIELVQKYFDYIRPQTNQDFDTIFAELSIIKFLRGDRD